MKEVLLMPEESYTQPVFSSSKQFTSGKVEAMNDSSILNKFKNLLKFLGPAFIVSVAYIDPPIFVLEHEGWLPAGELLDKLEIGFMNEKEIKI